MAVLTVFKSHIQSCKYHFKSGKEANFILGKYATNDEIEIKELEAEVKARHPFIYIDAEEKTIDTEVSPIQRLKDQIRAELMAEMAASGSTDRDMGATSKDPVKPASTVDVEAKSAGAAKIAGIKAAVAEVGK